MSALLLCALAILIHLFIHEAGHALAAVSVGSKIKRVGVNKLGVYIVRAPASTGFKNALVALAGPAANLATWALMLSFHIDGALAPLVFGLANLLPFPHSDLMQAIHYLRSQRWPLFS